MIAYSRETDSTERQTTVKTSVEMKSNYKNHKPSIKMRLPEHLNTVIHHIIQ